MSRPVASARKIAVTAGGGHFCGRFEAMASPCEVLCEVDDGDEARRLTELAAAEAWRVEEKFSRYRRGNVVERINRAGGRTVKVDTETAQLIDFSETLYRLSEGRFDITCGALRSVWTFDGNARVPTVADTAAVLESVGWHRVRWQSPQLTLPRGMEIDLGGIGKEYAVDRAAMLLREASGAGCLVNFGGDLAVTRRPAGRAAWKVGIESVGGSATVPQRLLNLATGALATSGDSRRYVEAGGRRYGHILDPTTGWPVGEAPRSVTVAADTCTQAGLFATLAMLAGNGAEAFLDAQGVDYWCCRDAD